MARDREGDPRLRPRREPDQRRHDHPGRVPAADRGAPQGVHQGRAHKAEDARISIRNVRRHAKDELDKLVKDGEAGEDEVHACREGAREGHPEARRRGRRAAQAQGVRAPRGLRARPPTIAMTDRPGRTAAPRSSPSRCSRSRRRSGAPARAATCPRPSASASASARHPLLAVRLEARLRRRRRRRRRARASGELTNAFGADRVRVPRGPARRGRGRDPRRRRTPAAARPMVVALALTVLGTMLWRLAGEPEGLRPRRHGRRPSPRSTCRSSPASRRCCCGRTTAPTGSSSSSCSSVLSDIGGYVAGVLFGKHPMAPTVSPKKSWEGFAGSALFCAVGGAVAVPLAARRRGLAGRR